ncbi:hypothetical protein ACFPRL_36540 [Pseudoclavibacter helvolus]
MGHRIDWDGAIGRTNVDQDTGARRIRCLIWVARDISHVRGQVARRQRHLGIADELGELQVHGERRARDDEGRHEHAAERDTGADGQGAEPRHDVRSLLVTSW